MLAAKNSDIYLVPGIQWKHCKSLLQVGKKEERRERRKDGRREGKEGKRREGGREKGIEYMIWKLILLS